VPYHKNGGKDRQTLQGCLHGQQKPERAGRSFLPELVQQAEHHGNQGRRRGAWRVPGGGEQRGNSVESWGLMDSRDREPLVDDRTLVRVPTNVRYWWQQLAAHKIPFFHLLLLSSFFLVLRSKKFWRVFSFLFGTAGLWEKMGGGITFTHIWM